MDPVDDDESSSTGRDHSNGVLRNESNAPTTKNRRYLLLCVAAVPIFQPGNRTPSVTWLDCNGWPCAGIRATRARRVGM